MPENKKKSVGIKGELVSLNSIEYGFDPKKPYHIKNGGICFVGYVKDEPVLKLISNFSAEIEEEITFFDGIESTKAFVISGFSRGKKLPKTTIPASKFKQLNWLYDAWGSAPSVFPGNLNQEKVRDAIQYFSNPKQKKIYRNTGWVSKGKNWGFLHGQGAITEKGLSESAQVDLESVGLAGFEFEKDQGHELATAFISVKKILEVVPDAIGFPLLASIFRAPLGELISTNFAIFLIGKSGTFKTQLAGIAQSFYGKIFSGTKLPASWSSTGNGLEVLCYFAKDVLIVVDDFAPQGQAGDSGRLQGSADQLIRGQGNNSGKTRLNQDSTLKKAKYSRGLILATGELLPQGASLRARCLILEIMEGDVNLECLTQLQESGSSGELNFFLREYICWLSKNMSNLKGTLPEKLEDIRRTFRVMNLHKRTPEVLANLTIGIDVFLDFCIEKSLIDNVDAEIFKANAQSALLSVASGQLVHFDEEEPPEQFVTAIRSLISSGEVHFDSESLCKGANDIKGIWHKGKIVREVFGKSQMIGWHKGDEFLLDSGLAHRAFISFYREKGRSLPIDGNTLFKRLAEKGLVRKGEKGKIKTRRKVRGNRRFVVVMEIETLYPKE